MKGRKKKQVGKIMLLLTKLDVGEYFYTDAPAKTVKAYCSTYDVKTKTEIVLSIENYKGLCPVAKKINKVTIV